MPHDTSDTDRRALLSRFRGRVLAIEGSIGVGKSTFIRTIQSSALQYNITCHVFDEPIPEHILEMYLGDKARYAFCFQYIMLKERIKTLKRAFKVSRPDNIVLLDRSVIGDTAFASMQHKSVLITDQEFKAWKLTLDDGWTVLQQHIAWPQFAVIALDCSAQCAFDRMRQRGITAEIANYTLDYFEQLAASYSTVLQHLFVPVVHIDWSDALTIHEGRIIHSDSVINALRSLIVPHCTSTLYLSC